MANGINRLIATQQGPDILGAVVGGRQAAQQLQAGDIKLQGAQTAQDRQNRLLQLQQMGATPTEMAQAGFVDQGAKLAQLRASLGKAQQLELDDTVKKATALTSGITDPNEFSQKVQASTLFDDDDKQTLLQLGPQGLARLAQSATGKAEVQSSKILPGGLVQLVRKDGTVEILPANEANKELVEASEARGAELQGLRAQEREVGKGTAQIALDSFDKVSGIRSNVANLREVISLVDDGAETGPLADKLPSFRAETIKLNTLKNQLGLDVVGSVTFGALSEGELNLALNTALPTNLDGPELINWANNKIAAQEKLANNLEEAAVFLSTPGNSVADWVKLKKNEKKEAEKTGAAGQTTVGRFQVTVE